MEMQCVSKSETSPPEPNETGRERGERLTLTLR